MKLEEQHRTLDLGLKSRRSMTHKLSNTTFQDIKLTCPLQTNKKYSLFEYQLAAFFLLHSASLTTSGSRILLYKNPHFEDCLRKKEGGC